ncbi:MAG: stalk domain-containing protein [Defluviitaleaceae bacterium]|nr:stalk domain-containing protein [Defluviitaleaceae bacterium]
MNRYGLWRRATALLVTFILVFAMLTPFRVIAEDYFDESLPEIEDVYPDEAEEEEIPDDLEYEADDESEVYEDDEDVPDHMANTKNVDTIYEESEVHFIIDAPDYFIQGNAFEFTVTSSVDGILYVYLDEALLFDRFIESNELADINVEAMPDVYAVTFLIEMADTQTFLTVNGIESVSHAPVAMSLAVNEVLWYSLHFSAPVNALTSGYLADFDNAVRTAHVGAGNFDFAFERTGSSGSQNVGGGWISFGGNIQNTTRYVRANAPLPTANYSFRVEVDFKTGSGGAERTLSLVNLNNINDVFASASSTLNGTNDPVVTVTHTFARGAGVPLLALTSSADVRLHGIRIIRIDDGGSSGGSALISGGPMALTTQGSQTFIDIANHIPANYRLSNAEIAVTTFNNTIAGQRLQSIWIELSDGTLVGTRMRHNGGDSDFITLGAPIDRFSFGTQTLANFEQGGWTPGLGSYSLNSQSEVTGHFGANINNPSRDLASANDLHFSVAIQPNGDWNIRLTVNDHAPSAMVATGNAGTGAYIRYVRAWSHHNTESILHLESWEVHGTPNAFIPAPQLELTGIAGGATHSFGSVPYHYNASHLTPFGVTVRNTGTATAQNLTVALTSGGTSFDLSGNTSVANLAIGSDITFSVTPRTGLASGTHNGVVSIAADGISPITFHVTFDVAFQEANVGWGADAAYFFDFSHFPTYMLNHADNAPNNDQRGVHQVLRGNMISTMANSTRTIHPSASQQNFNFVVGAPGLNNSFRPGHGTVSDNIRTFIEPNGAGRYLESTVQLTGPIRIELRTWNMINNGSYTVTASFAGQTISQTITGNQEQMVIIEFPTGETGDLIIGHLPWGGAGATSTPGRYGIMGINIYEGAFTGPWLESPVGFAIEFPALPHGYTSANLVTEYVPITNVGIGPTTISTSIGSHFAITSAPSSLNAGQGATIGVRPIAGLPSGLYEDELIITTNNANTVRVPVSVRVNNPLELPAVPLFYSGVGTSLEGQFPNDVEENPGWQHHFRRVVFTADSHLIRLNGHLRDSSTSLAIPFVLNHELWVPIESARLALPNTDWSVNGSHLTVTQGGTSYNGTALTATFTANGGNAVFVPLQSVARALNVGNIGWDTRSHTLIVTTGINVEQGNVLYNNINNRPEAWYGSSNALAIATNFVYMQRANGGWPRGNGQINALPFQPDVGGMSPDIVQTIATNFTAEDSYFGRGITTNETRFLLRMYEATGIERFRVSGLRGLDTIYNVQDGGGGWPYQISGGSYHRGVSISDNAIENIMTLLMDIDNGMFVDTIGATRVTRNTVAFEAGMAWILGSQVRSAAFADGIERLTGWPFHTYQYNIASLSLFDGAIPGVPGEPAWAREFEPPSISGNESIDIIEFLMSIPNPSQEIQDAIHGAVFFFDYVQIRGYRLYHNPAGHMHPLLGRHLVPDPNAPALWARFIDIDTFQPLFSDRVVPSSSPHAGVPLAAFEAEHGAWLGTPANHISHNATSPTNARGGTFRSLYRDANGNLSTNPNGTFDLPATFHNLSHERRMGFNYINTFAANLPAMYAAWRIREGINLPSQPPQPPSTDNESSDDDRIWTAPVNHLNRVDTLANDGGVSVTVVIQDNNTVHVELPNDVVSQLIHTADNATIVLDFADFADIETVQLTRTAMRRIANAQHGMEIILPQGTIAFDYSALHAIGQIARNINIAITMTAVEVEYFALEGFEFVEVLITSGSLVIDKITGTVTVKLSYDGELPASVWLLDENGEKIFIQAEFDETLGMIIFETEIIGVFAIGYNPNHDVAPLTEEPLIHIAISSPEVVPFIEGDYTMVPLRLISEALGANVDWNENTGTVYVTINGTILRLAMNEPLPNNMGTPMIVNNRTFVPVRYFSEILGANIRWDDSTQSIYLYD